MSKIQLKKELNSLDRDQLIQLVLDLYSARKEAKAYFEFFLNPDVDALREKYEKDILKELARGKYGRSKARISKVRQAIKDFASFGVGPEAEVDLMLTTLATAVIEERHKYVTKAYVTGTGKILESIIEIADKNLMAEQVMPRIGEILNGKLGSKSFTNFLRRQIQMDTI